MFLGHLAVGFAAKRAAPRAGPLWSFVAFAALIYAADLLGPPPPSPKVIGWAGLAQWLWIPWAALIDRHRALRDRALAGALAA
jgi:hypothetical protein